MNEKYLIEKSKNQKIYESVKQDILNLASIKNTFNNAIRKNNIIIPRIFLNQEKAIHLKSNTIKNLELNIKNSKLSPRPLKNLEKIIHKRFHRLYLRDEDFYNIKIIDEIISNDSSHIVAEFKDFLIKDDYSEFIQKFFNKKESLILLNQIFEYYKLSSVVYPNYILLPEKKYIYKNIQKKQKIIDDQQEQEENNKDEGQNIIWTDRNKPLNNSEKVFDSKIIDSILNQSNTSQIQKFIFGVSNESSIDIEDNYLFDIVKNINKAEESSYSKFIESNKLINNHIIKNNVININNKENNNKKKEKKDKENLLNSNKIKYSDKMKQFINNDINNGNKIKSRNHKNIKELTDFGKTHTYFSSNLSNIKNINNKSKNVFSSYINKEKGLHIKKQLQTRNSSNEIKKGKYIFNGKIQNLTNENIKTSISKLNKDKTHGRNNKKNIFDFINNDELNKIFKSDWDINNNNINYLKNNKDTYEKNAIIIKHKEKKDKSEKNNNKNLLYLDKIKFPPIQNLEISEKPCNENIRYIKKTVINELLSLGSTKKDILRESKLSESKREISHSINRTEREKKSIKYAYNFKRKKNESDISDNIYKYMNNTSRQTNSVKRIKEISLDNESMNRKSNLIKRSQNNTNNIIKSHIKKNSNIAIKFQINSNNEKASIPDNKYLKNDGFFSGKSFNENKHNLNNIKNKDISAKKQNLKLNIGNDNIVNCVSQVLNEKDYNQNKSSRNNTTFLNSKNLTYTLVNVKKFINTNNNTNNNNYHLNGKHYSNNNVVQNEKINANSTRFKDKFKLKLDLFKQNENIYKKIETTRESFIQKNNAINSNECLSKQLNNNVNIQKTIELCPLSAREYNKNNNNNSILNSQIIKNIKNCNGVLKKDNKFMHKTLKNSLNEKGINNIISGYSNSYKNKNKYIKKIKNSKISNHHLLLSNFINKKEEEKKEKNSTLSELGILPKNKRKISNNINPNITNNNYYNNSELNSLLITNFNSSVNNLTLKHKSRNNLDNNLKEIKTIINLNYNEKINNKNNLIHTPNIRKKIQENIYDSNKKSSNNENFLISNKNININNKNTRYYNIEVNIHNDNKNSNKDKISINKIQNNSKQHIKLNSTQFSAGSLNINFNNYTNNYCVNYNNNSIVTTNQNKQKYTQIESKVYKYKRIKNLKNNIKGYQKNKNNLEKLATNKNSNIYPLSFTDRNKKVNLISPLNAYSVNAFNKNKK